MVTMSDDPTSAAMPFEQFTDNDGADYDKRLFFIIDNIEGSSLFEKSYSPLIYMFRQVIDRPSLKRGNLTILKWHDRTSKGCNDLSLQLDSYDGNNPIFIFFR